MSQPPSLPTLTHSVTLFGVGLLSAAMLSLELTLTRLFAVAQFYHFAFMVISLALIGSGAAGSLLRVWPGLGRAPGRWAAGFSLAALGSFAILNLIPFDSYAIAWDRRQVIYLATTLIGTAAPFLFSGLVVGGLMAEDAAGLHRIYAANLVGSALGCLIVLPLLGWVGAEGALLISAGMALAAAMLFAWQAQRADRDPPLRKIGLMLMSVAGVAILVALAVIRPDWLAIRLTPYKSLYQAMLTPGARLVLSEWAVAARVDVVESSSIHAMPGLSQNALIMEPPLQSGLTIDGDNLQPITHLDPDDDLARTLAGNVPVAAAFALRPDAQTFLVLEPGGGWDVLMLLAGGAPQVTVVERHRAVIDLLSGSLYGDPRVTAVQAETRAFLRRSDERFDVIVIALSDSFHPVTSGAYSLGEDYRYTVEAISDCLDHLSPGGVLLVTRWLQTPPTESLRTLAAVEAALRGREVSNPGEYIAAFRSLRTVTLVAGAGPLDEADRAALRGFVDQRGYDLVWMPDISPDEVNVNNRVPEPLHYQQFAALLADPPGFIKRHEFDIRPATDDRPFFYHYFRWRQTPDVLATLGHTWQPFGGSGYFVLVALLIIVTLLAAGAIFGPLLVKPLPVIGTRKVHILIYFFMLGLAFLFIEIPLAQRLILLAGQPVTAFSITIFTLLLCSGLGSLTAPRWTLGRALLALVIVAVLTPLALRVVVNAALGWALIPRLLAANLTLAPLGFLMGIPFAAGMRLVEAQSPGLIAWAWAINGSASVIGGVLAMMAALGWGFTAVLWLGAGAYGVAWVAAVTWSKQNTF